MPEFIMETSGQVELAVRWQDLDAFTQGFLEAAFFTECSPVYDSEEWESEECQTAIAEGQADGNIPGDAGFSDLDPTSLVLVREFCRRWQAVNAGILQEAYERDYDAMQAGRDLWFTHNGHGVGFWDRKPLDAGGLGDRLSEAAGRGEIGLEFYDGKVGVWGCL